MTKAKWLILIAFLILIGGFYVYKMSSKIGTNQEIITITKQTIPQTIKVPGTVVPLNRVQVFPPVAGRIEALFVAEGSQVKEGDVLALMSSFERAAVLDKAKGESPEKLAYWKRVYLPTQLFAPVTGKVIVRNMNVGQTVANNTELVVIADQLIVKAQIDETDLAKIHLQLPVTVTLDTYPDRPCLGKISHISFESTVVNNVSVYYIQIALNQTPAYFLSGMSASIIIHYGTIKNALSIPDRALHQEQNKTFVWIKDKSERGYSPREVCIGAQSNGVTAILSGLKEADQVVVVTEIEKKTHSLGFYPFNQKRKP